MLRCLNLLNYRIAPLLHGHRIKHAFPRMIRRNKPQALMFFLLMAWTGDQLHKAHYLPDTHHHKGTVRWARTISSHPHLCWSQICLSTSWFSTLSPDFHFLFEPCRPFFISASAILDLSHLSSDHSRPGNSSWSCMTKLQDKRNYVTGLPDLSELRIRHLIGNETDTSSNDWFTCARVRPATHLPSFDSAERTPLSCSLQRGAWSQCRIYFAQEQSSMVTVFLSIPMFPGFWPPFFFQSTDRRGYLKCNVTTTAISATLFQN